MTALVSRARAAMLVAALPGIVAGAGTQAVTLALRETGATFAPRPESGEGWRVLSAPATRSAAAREAIQGPLPGGGTATLGIMRLSPGPDCAFAVNHFAQGDPGRRFRRSHFFPMAGWHGEGAQDDNGDYLVCRDGPSAILVLISGLTGQVEEGSVLRGVLEPLAASLPVAPGRAVARPTPSSPTDTLTLDLTGVTFRPRAGVALAWNASSGRGTSGQGHRMAIELLEGRLASGDLLRVGLTQGEGRGGCDVAIADRVGSDPARRLQSNFFFPVEGWHPVGAEPEPGVYFLCLDRSPPLLAVVMDLRGTSEEGRAIRGLLEPLSEALAANARRPATAAAGSPGGAGALAAAAAPGVRVNLSRNALAFTIPPSSWTWIGQGADMGGDPGAVMIGTDPRGRTIELGVRAVSGTLGPSTCLEYARQFGRGEARRDARPWRVAALSPYYGRRGDDSVQVCLPRGDAVSRYVLVTINGNLEDVGSRDEVRRMLAAIRDAP